MFRQRRRREHESARKAHAEAERGRRAERKKALVDPTTTAASDSNPTPEVEPATRSFGPETTENRLVTAERGHAASLRDPSVDARARSVLEPTTPSEATESTPVVAERGHATTPPRGRSRCSRPGCDKQARSPGILRHAFCGEACRRAVHRVLQRERRWLKRGVLLGCDACRRELAGHDQSHLDRKHAFEESVRSRLPYAQRTPPPDTNS